MNVSFKTVISSFLLAVSIIDHVEGQNECAELQCGGFGPSIRFPFRLNSQPNQCGYPGFNLSCTTRNETVLQLPFLVNFFVKNIDNRAQVIHLYDPQHCLPRQLRELNLSSSPFRHKYEYGSDFAFYNCSPTERNSMYAYPVSCLSGPSYQVYTFDSYSNINDLPIASCTKMYNLRNLHIIPGVDDILELKWSIPACGHCESKGKKCRLKNNSTKSETECFSEPTKGIVSIQIPPFCSIFSLFPSQHVLICSSLA